MPNPKIFPPRIKVAVTRGDIVHGAWKDSERCAVARAVRRTVRGCDADVTEVSCAISIGPETEYYTADGLCEFVRQYDHGDENPEPRIFVFLRPGARDFQKVRESEEQKYRAMVEEYKAKQKAK